MLSCELSEKVAYPGFVRGHPDKREMKMRYKTLHQSCILGPTRKHPEFLFEAIWDYVQIEGLLKENEALCERLQRYQAQQGFAQGTSKLAFAHGTLTSDNGEGNVFK